MTGTGKRILMVAGGWEGHEPRKCAEISQHPAGGWL